jgi:APA family basic amino acid/polyamine antiporter
VFWKQVLARKNLDTLLAEMASGKDRLRRVLGPVSLTSLGVGCIIGAGIFVMTGSAAANDAGPAVVVSFAIAALSCAMAALCYAEFAAMAPVAGSAYAYAYTTLGEIFAWIIGWDLILEYAMGCSTVASAWSNYFNAFLLAISPKLQIPPQLLSEPFTPVEGLAGHPWLNLPSVVIMVLVTIVLVVGIRESARTNAVLVMIKVSVVLFVIAVGCAYVHPTNWNSIPTWQRVLPEERAIPGIVKDHFKAIHEQLSLKELERIDRELNSQYHLRWAGKESQRLLAAGRLSPKEAQGMVADVTRRVRPYLAQTEGDRRLVDALLPEVQLEAEKARAENWGLLGEMGLDRWLLPIDDATRSPFTPYGLPGIMLGAAIVFFAYIGFDSISTHAEEARNPQRDVPIGILVSLLLCTVLYIAVASVVTGMVPYRDIDINAPIADAFKQTSEIRHSIALRAATGLVAAGGLAGMTSVLLVLFLSQARIFMAMARDGLLPPVFGRVHPRFRTPHVATIVTGVVICLVSAFTPIDTLKKMVNIGTLLAFAMVCAAVLVLRVRRPDARRPFRCPMIYLVAPLGIAINLALTLFLDSKTWLRLVVWLAIGLVIYAFYSRRHSLVSRHLMHEITAPPEPPIDASAEEA